MYGSNLTAYDSSFKRLGNYSGKITTTAGTEKYVHSDYWMPINNTVATSYTFSGWVYSNGPVAEIYLFQNASGETGYFTAGSFVRSTTVGQWVKITGVVSVPANITSLNIRLDNNGNVWGTVWFDDIQLKKTSNASEIIEENNYYAFGMQYKGYNNSVIANGSSQAQKYKYNGKELQDELGLGVYDYGARNYDPAIGRWFNIDPLAEVSRRWSPYSYCYNSPLIFVDPDGMLATPPTDIYDMNGQNTRHIDDNKNDKYLSLTNSASNKIAGQTDAEVTAALNSGGYGTQVVTVPSNEVIDKMDQSISNTNADGNEWGFGVATDNTTSNLHTDGKPGSISPNSSLNDITAADKTPSYFVHDHGVGKITLSADGKSFNAEGGHIPSVPDDHRIQGSMQQNGNANHPSAVLGTEISNVQVTNGKISNMTQTPTITYYNQNPAENTTVNYADYKKAVNTINP